MQSVVSSVQMLLFRVVLSYLAGCALGLLTKVILLWELSVHS